MCTVRNLSVAFNSGKQSQFRDVLKGVNFDLFPGEVTGLLGESGSGKSTLALTMLRTLPAGARVRGSITFEGRDLLRLGEREMRQVRGARMAIVFQDPGLALNPVMPVGIQIIEVLRAHHKWKPQRLRDETKSLLDQVGLDDISRIFKSYPHELSGGQAQRVLIAQALACRPAMLIADEPTASLDSTIQAEILALLEKLRREYNMAMLFITHNPALLLTIAQRVMVMHEGEIVEQGATAAVFSQPGDAFTKSLVSAMEQRVLAAAWSA
ncbi:MAG TPA: ABC transporter ATP-binding protein [Verrucomicrobiae bacterium]|jgi:ABC-type glutathione transport system ATPase component|nr:ABC transporter ATP-binding protein [Verrucomicrobiae bacterium]